MTLAELKAAAEANLARPDSSGMLLLKLPGRMVRGRKRLAGKRGPLGRIVGEIDDRTVLVDFDAREVLRWVGRARVGLVGG